MTPIDKDKIPRYRSRAVKSAWFNGAQDDSEDIAQDVILKFLTKEKSGQSITQAAIQRIREDRGKEGTVRNAVRNASEYKDGERGHGANRDYLMIEERLDLRELFYSVLGELNQIDRAIVLLRMSDWEMHEIGFLFGITESRISQRLKLIREWIRKRKK